MHLVYYILPRFSSLFTAELSLIVSDCRGPYWKFDNLSHAICNAHILRELKGIHENDTKESWAEDMRPLLREMIHVRHEAERAGASALPSETVQAFQARYDAILEQAAGKNPLPVRQPGQRGKFRKGKVRCLIDCLTAHWDEALLFLADFRVPSPIAAPNKASAWRK